MTPRRARAAGFTLLEVLVAISILGLGLTSILSAQTGLFASSTRTERNSFAIGLLRCKMSEIELKFLKEGFSLVDETDQGPCCEEEPEGDFKCSWKVERVTLPEASSLDEQGESPLGELGDLAGATSGGPLGGLQALEQTQGGVLGDNADLSSVAGVLGGGAGAADAIIPMLMSLVYPSLKPMLEASIRRVTVTVAWKEGHVDRDLSVTQFATYPQMFDPDAAEGMGGAPGSPGSPGAPATPLGGTK